MSDDGILSRAEEFTWPANILLERRVLGSMTLHAESAQHARHALQPEDFYDLGNRKLFNAFVASMRNGELDTDLVLAECNRDHFLWDRYLELTPDFLHGERNEAACAHLRELSTLRAVATATIEVKSALLQSPVGADAGKVLDWVTTKLTDVLARREPGVTGRSLEEVMGEIIRKTLEPPAEIGCAATPLHGLNGLLNGGFENGAQYVIAGRPGTGKTSFALDCALFAAVAGRHVMVYSFEMSDVRLAERLVAARAQLNSQIIRRPHALRDQQKAQIIDAAMKLAKLPMQIVSASGWTIDQVVRHAQREHLKRPLGMICVDYAGRVKVNGKRSREEEVGTVSAEINNLAIRCNCPSLLLAQLNRDVEKRSSQRPVLSDLRESGSLEQDADCVIFTWHDEAGNSELIVGKNRNGETNSVPVKFQKQFTRFVDL